MINVVCSSRIFKLRPELLNEFFDECDLFLKMRGNKLSFGISW